MEMLEEHRCFEGWQQRWRHDSSTLNCPMTFSIFLPPPRDHTPYSAAIFLIPICISFDTAEKRRYATYLILNRRFSFEF